MIEVTYAGERPVFERVSVTVTGSFGPPATGLIAFTSESCGWTTVALAVGEVTPETWFVNARLAVLKKVVWLPERPEPETTDAPSKTSNVWVVAPAPSVTLPIVIVYVPPVIPTVGVVPEANVIPGSMFRIVTLPATGWRPAGRMSVNTSPWVCPSGRWTVNVKSTTSPSVAFGSAMSEFVPCSVCFVIVGAGPIVMSEERSELVGSVRPPLTSELPLVEGVVETVEPVTTVPASVPVIVNVAVLPLAIVPPVKLTLLPLEAFVKPAPVSDVITKLPLRVSVSETLSAGLVPVFETTIVSVTGSPACP